MIIKSRILKYLNLDVMKDMNKICQSKRTTDNNKKAEMIIEILDKHNIDYDKLGAGTNRVAVLIDGYVFKIALDKWGLQDNKNEYTTSKELQPFVAKTYECNENGLVLVGEYVTVLSREEFNDELVKDEMRKILGLLSFQYLLDDVGVVLKNFMNWGYRDNGQLVILDYAYIFHIEGEEMICSNVLSEDNVCSGLLSYGPNFDIIYCPSCNKKFTAMDIRRRIDYEFEKKQNEIARLPQFSYKVTEPETVVSDSEEEVKQDNNSMNKKGEIRKMEKDKKYYYDDINNQEDEGFDLEDILNYGFPKEEESYNISDDGYGEIIIEDVEEDNVNYEEVNETYEDGYEEVEEDNETYEDNHEEYEQEEESSKIYDEENIQEIEEFITDTGKELDTEEIAEQVEEAIDNITEDYEEESNEVVVTEDDEDENYRGITVQKPSIEEDDEEERRKQLITDLFGDDKYSEYDNYLDEADSIQMEYKKRQYNNKKGK